MEENNTNYGMAENSLKEKLNITLFLSGKVVSLLGTYTYSFAMALYIMKVTGSGTSFVLSVLMSMVPRIVLGPFAGALADRVERKKIVVGLDFLSGIVVLGLLGISSIYGLKVVYIYIATLLLSIISTFFDVTINAALPNLVYNKSLMKINAYTQASASLSSILGPVIGGVVYGLVPMNIFLLINGVSFIFSAISEMFIDFEFNKIVSGEVPNKNEKLSLKSMIVDIKEVFYFIKNQSTLFSMLKFILIFNLLINSFLAVIFPFIINNKLRMTSTQYGVIEAAFSVGVLIASIVIGRLPEKRKNLKGLFAGTLMMGIMIIAMGIPTISLFRTINNAIVFVYYLVVLAVFAVFLIVVETPLQVSLHRLAPDNLRGRVWGVMGTLSSGIAPIGIILLGFLIDIAHPFIITLVCGTVICMTAMVMYRSRGMQDY